MLFPISLKKVRLVEPKKKKIFDVMLKKSELIFPSFGHQGHPYMESMRENRALLYSLMATGSFIFLLACGVIPEVSEQFGIIEFPPEV